MTYFVIAYLLLWGLLFGYVFSIVARQKRLEREVALWHREEDGERDPLEG